MSMTKKDYELVASVIKQAQEDGVSAEQTEGFSYDMAHALELANPKFDKQRFLELCGLK